MGGQIRGLNPLFIMLFYLVLYGIIIIERLGVIMSNKTYDILKYIALIFLPALTTFVGVVLNCFDVQCTDIILTIMVAFDTFLGSVLKLSSNNYKGDE